ncbi:MAG: terminase family protein, partial [Planctomycetales bacterium]|nr:terminase family protein [Planctomycetales bacterium]
MSETQTLSTMLTNRSTPTRRERPRPSLDRCPHEPSARQRLFLSLACREAFYGGAAGGGKSEALLMGALQYAHVPGYAALILRKDTQRLQLAGGLIPRSHTWLAGGDARWNETRLQWTFPTTGAPATLSFGYLQSSTDKYRYGSSEYQYIAFDELTEFAEEDYRFLFSRLRSTRAVAAPLRMRAASNPGGPGHAWVKARFIPPGAPASGGVHPESGIGFVPATIHDNPHLDADAYLESLAHLPAVLRQRLAQGDWSIADSGLIRQGWLRHYVCRDRMLELQNAAGEPIAHIDERQCRRFATIDPAGTSEDRARERRGR